MFLVSNTRTLRHEITQVVVEHKHAQLLRRLVGTLDHVCGPLTNDSAHDDERQWQAELATQIEKTIESFGDSRESTFTADTIVSCFVAVDGKNDREVPDSRHRRKMALHEGAVGRDQHIEIAVSECFE